MDVDDDDDEEDDGEEEDKGTSSGLTDDEVEGLRSFPSHNTCPFHKFVSIAACLNI